jgi:DNA-binding protein HU-beta
LAIAPIKLSLEDVMKLEDEFSVTLGAPTGVLGSSLKRDAKGRSTSRERELGVSHATGSKSKIVAVIAEKTDVPKKTAAAFFEELFKLAVKECKGGAGKFVIPGIGRVVKAHRKARMGRNPQTGEQVKIKAKTVVRVRPSKAFKDAILK